MILLDLKIVNVDRSNTSASILPCKIIKIIQKGESSKKLCKVANLNRIISEYFSSSDLIDLSKNVYLVKTLIDFLFIYLFFRISI